MGVGGIIRFDSSAPISVRGLETSDRRQWEELWADYNAFYGRTGDAALVPEVVETTWARLLDESEPVHGFLGVSDGVPVGLAHVVFHPNLIQSEPTCYMQDLFTVPEARGAGVAGALIEAVCSLCRARGAVDVYWHTHEGLDARVMPIIGMLPQLVAYSFCSWRQPTFSARNDAHLRLP